MIVVLVWLLAFFAFVGLGASSSSGSASAPTVAQTRPADCIAPAPAGTRLAPNVRLGRVGRLGPNAGVARRGAPPQQSLPDSASGCRP